MAWGHPWAHQWGGGGDQQSPLEIEFQALLDCYAPGWTSADSTQSAVECRAMALGLACIWAINQRLKNIMVPASMLESLPTWEEACSIRPLQDETIMQRRAAIAARFIGFAGNTTAVIFDVCRALAGDLFLGINVIAPTLTTNYEPAINPGPAGFEWSSNRCTICVRLSKTGPVGSTFLDLIRRIKLELALICPCWMTYTIGTDESGWVVGRGVCGITLLGP